MARVFDGEPIFLDRLLGPLERGIYRLAGVPRDPAERETLYRPLALKEAAPRPPWYPADSPWPPQGGDLSLIHI